MDAKTLFLHADSALSAVISQIKDDQWDMVMPEDFDTRDTAEVTLREIVNYHAYDEAWVPDTLAGKTIEEVGDAYDGDLLGDDPGGSYAAIVNKTVVAVEALDDVTKPVHLSYGDFPAGEYLQHISLFRGLRAHDIAKAIGVDATLPEDLVQGLWDLLQGGNAEYWRSMGVYGPAVEVSEDDTLQNRLLGLTSRQPD